jgi:hypothetical protein
MTRHATQPQLSDFDMMMIRAGCRTQAELEGMALNKFGFDVLCRICALFADALYHLVILLEAGSHRSFEFSHHRLNEKATG